MKALKSIARSAFAHKEGSEYLQAKLLLLESEYQNIEDSGKNNHYINSVDELLATPFMDDNDRAVLLVYKLNLLSSIMESDEWCDEETGPQQTARTALPKDVNLYTKADLLRESYRIMQEVKELLPKTRGTSLTRYQHIFVKELEKYASAYPLSYLLVSQMGVLFDLYEPSLFQIEYQLHPANSVLTFQEIAGPLKALELRVQSMAGEPENIYALFFSMLVEEERSSKPREAIAYEMLRYGFAEEYLSDEERMHLLQGMEQRLRAEKHTSPLYDEVLYAQADLYIKEKAYEKALALCQEIESSPVASKPLLKAVKILKASINERVLSITVANEASLSSETAISIEMRYRNLKQVALEFYPISSEQLHRLLLDRRYNAQESFIRDFISKLNGKDAVKPFASYSYKLDSTTHEMKSVTQTVAPLPLGAYVVVARSPQLKCGPVYASSLLMISNIRCFAKNDEPNAKRSRNGFSAQVMHAKDGAPYPNVELYSLDAGGKERLLTMSNDKGELRVDSMPSRSDSRFCLRCPATGDLYAPDFGISQYNYEKPKKRSGITLFTDRAIYQPGQVLYFKAVAYQQKGVTQQQYVKEGSEVKVTAYNLENYVKVEVGQFTTDAQGAIYGHWSVPQGRVLGDYQLVAQCLDVDARSAASFAVEAYKRPKIEAKVSSPEKEWVYGSKVVPELHVAYLSGPAVVGAAVHYQVKARINRGFWYRDTYTYELQHGDGYTNSQGSFQPDEPLHLAFSDEMRKLVEARFGFPPQELSITFIYEVRVVSKEGEALETSYSYYIEPPIAHIDRQGWPDVWVKEQPSMCTLRLTDSRNRMLPNVSVSYSLVQKATHKKVLSGSFKGEWMLNSESLKGFPSGEYQLHFSIKDAKYHLLKSDAIHNIALLSVKDRRTPCDTTLWVYPLRKTYSSASPRVEFLVGTAEPHQHIYIYTGIPNKERPLKQMLLSNEMKRITLPLAGKEAVASVLIWSYRNGKLFSRVVELRREEPDPGIHLVVEGLKEQYKPGEKGQVTVRLLDKHGNPCKGTLSGWMYDAALDRIAPYTMPEIAHLWSAPQVDLYRNVLYFPSVGMYESFSAKHIPDYSDYVSIWNLWNENLFRIALFPRLYFGDYLMLKATPSKTRAFGNIPLTVAQAESHDDANELNAQAAPAASSAEKDRKSEPLRKDFREVVFWEAALPLDENGSAQLHFTMPESLSEYKLCLFAYNPSAQSFTTTRTVKVAKELSIMPNIPRYIRAEDSTSIAVTVINGSAKAVSGDLVMRVVHTPNKQIHYQRQIPIHIAANAQQTLSFPLLPIDEVGMLGITFEVQAGGLSDAQYNDVPVLPIRKGVVESISLTAYSGAKDKVSLSQLNNLSNPLAKNRVLYFNINANPLWGALDALPAISLKEDCSDVISKVAGLLATSIAYDVVRENPLFASYLKQRREGSQKAGESRLLKDKALRIVQTDMTPFLGTALQENATMQALVKYTDQARTEEQMLKQVEQIAALQNSDGGFAWVPSFHSSFFITQRTAMLLSTLNNDKVKSWVAPILRKAESYLKNEILNRLGRASSKEARISILLNEGVSYLYITRDHYKERPALAVVGLEQEVLAAMRQAIPNVSVLMLPDYLTIFAATGDSSSHQKCKERLLSFVVDDAKLGKKISKGAQGYPRYDDLAMMLHCMAIRALEPEKDCEALVEQMRLWLLNQKRAASWGNELVSAAAISTLFMQQNKLMSYGGPASLELSNGSVYVVPEKESSNEVPPTKQLVKSLTADDKIPTWAELSKEGKGVAWASVTATFDMPMSQLKEHQSENLSVERKLYVLRRNENNEERWIPIYNNSENNSSLSAASRQKQSQPLFVGDKVMVELIIRTRRSMDFVVVTDYKSAAFELGNETSHDGWSSGHHYYQENRDSRVTFFLDSLNKDVVKLTYTATIDRRGDFFGGMAQVQAAYAPDMVAHSSGDEVLHIQSTSQPKKK